MKISAKIFLEDNHRYLLGPGRLALLKATGELGSLNKAAQAMGMSYRWAWGRMRDSEKALGIRLLTQDGDGGRGKPKVLTTEARALLQWYGELEATVAAALETAAAKQPDFLDLDQKSPPRPGQGRSRLD